MNKNYVKLLSACLLLLFVSIDVQAQTKRAQTTFKFVSTPLTARQSGLSDAMYSLESGAESMFANPAGMARVKEPFNIVVGQVAWIADINYHYAAATYSPKNGLYGVFGFQVISVDYGDLDETIIATNPRGYLDLGTFSPRAYSLGISYARAISNQFSIGGSVKYLGVDFGAGSIGGTSGQGQIRENFKSNVIAYDFGVHYKTGYESLELGFAFKNLAPEVDYNTESTEIPLTFRMGASMNVLDFTDLSKDTHKLVVSLNANRPRDFDEQFIIGSEYTFLNRFIVRGGYLLPADEQGVSFGAGIVQPIYGNVGLKVDYSYTNFGVFSNVNRFTVQFTF